MNTKEAIKASADLSRMVLGSYISDLDDADLLLRPAEGCNHLAWQLGHLVASECMLLEMVMPGAAAELPEGFADKHGKENAGSDDPADFCTKQEYSDLLEKVFAATLAALEETTDEQLDTPSPENFANFAPTHGHIYALIATHPMMHAGQFVPIRRRLSKPILM